MKQAMSFSRRELLLLAAVLLLATVLRLGWPKLTEFKFSEARLEALALELTREGRLPLVGVPSSAGFDHSPVSVYLYVPAFLFTTNPIPATIYGGLVGTVAVALCWGLARRWPGGGRWAALVTALLFAVSPWLVAYSRKIWQVTFVPLLTLGFVGLVISALVEPPNPSRSNAQRWHLAWALVVYALLVQVHPSAVSLAPSLLLWLVVFWRRVRLVPLLTGGLLGTLTAVPFIAHQIRSGWPALAALRSLPEVRWDLSAVRLAWEAITGRSIHALAGDAYPLLKTVPQIGWIFNLIGWLAVGASLWLLWRMLTGWRAEEADKQLTARVDLVLLSWLAVPVIFNLRHSLDLYLHFFALVAPAAYLIIGRVAESAISAVRARMPDGRQPAPWHRPLVIVVGMGLGLLAVAQVVVLILMAQFVATHDTPGGFGTPLARYLDLADRTVAMAEDTGVAEVLVVGQGDSIEIDATPAIFDVLLRDRVAYRFVDGQSAAVFPPHQTLVLLTPAPGVAASWYEPWPARDLQEDYRLVALDGTWPQDSFHPVRGPRAFENGVELQGYAWESVRVDQGRFWLMWQVLWLSPDDTHFFVHLLDRETQLWGQKDSAGYPTDYRHRGDRVVSLFDIAGPRNPSTAPYQARVGLYFYPQVVNVPVIDEAGKPIGDAVTMELLGRGQ